MRFRVPEESSLGDGLGEGYGMLGQAGSGKLRVSVGPSNLAAKVAKKFKEKHYGSSGATSGLTSSLAFTSVQGIELTNPQAHASLTWKWYSKHLLFRERNFLKNQEDFREATQLCVYIHFNFAGFEPHVPQPVQRPYCWMKYSM
ncbi:U4/U6 small nuclear ribonucleoprotein Prp31 homolog [Aristolochia californica]|uniref:U4/U6 small nuclear ribonucleoprotein Prp31 homolog n=1 Tax=Aristolochia californica TaxID=171875 RepID=UPI0035DDD8ED